MEVVGISFLIQQDQRESTVCRILQHIGVNITDNKIEACHRLGRNNGRTIAKISNKMDCEHTMRVKKEFKDLYATDLDLPAGTKLYINDRCVLTTESLGMKPRNCGMRKTLSYLIALYQLRLTFKEQFNDYLLIWMFNSKRANNVVKKIHEGTRRLLHNDCANRFIMAYMHL